MGDAPGAEYRSASAAANKLVDNYARSGYRRIYRHLQKVMPNESHDYLTEQSFNLLGSIIGRSLSSFSQELFMQYPAFASYDITPYVGWKAMNEYRDEFKPSAAKGR